MTNTPIDNARVSTVPEATRIYLRGIEEAIEETQANLEKLKAVRSTLNNEILGENLYGMSKVLDGAGPPLDESAVTALEGAIEDAVKEVEETSEDLK